MLIALLSLAFAQSTPPKDAPDTEASADEDADETAETGEQDEAEAPAEPEEPVVLVLGKPYKATRPGQIQPDSPYWELEVLYEEQKHLEGYELAKKMYAETGNPHLTLYIARSLYQHLEGNEQITDKKERMEYYERGLSALEEGLAKTPDDVHLKFAYGVMLGRMGTTRGVLASLRYADDIENAWTDVIKSDYRYASIGLQEELPCDAFLALGIFYRLVPDSWLVSAIAGTRGSLDKSLEMQEKGAKCAGTRIRNQKELGVTQMCIGVTRDQPEMIEAGRASINKYLALEPRMQAEIVDMKHGIALLKDPSIACGYSRDGQQDIDASKLEGK